MDLSFQLYSGRNFPLDEVLKTVGEHGYRYVEGYDGMYDDVEGLLDKLVKNGLSMPTAHMGLSTLKDRDSRVALARKLGLQVVICPWVAPADRPTDAQSWAEFGRALEVYAKEFMEDGYVLAYHNHDFEFFKLPDGRYPLDVLFEAAPSLKSELDVAWVYRGNADPFDWIEKNADRVVCVHVKDLAAEGENAEEDGWADVGHGRIPWADVLAHIKAKTDAKYFIVEHDNPSDIVRFAERSIASVNSFGA